MNQDHTRSKTGNSISPSLLEFYRIADQRDLLTSVEKLEFARMEKGSIGEEIVHHFIRSEGSDRWTLLRNKWLNEEGPFECDLILLANHTIYTFEVKHYTGRFTYENGACMIGNIKMENDCIQQARKSFLKLQKICKLFNSKLTVKGALVFSNNKNKVVIKSPVEDIQIFELPDLYECLQNIKLEENRIPYPPIDHDALIQHLKQYEINNQYFPQPISPEVMLTARKGICCGMCRSYDVTYSRFYVHCDCGFHESREEAIVRTACEYGLLTYDRDFRTSDILSFIDYKGSPVYVQKILAKHFYFLLNNSHSRYKNLVKDYSTLTDYFHFEKPAYYYSKSRPPKLKST